MQAFNILTNTTFSWPFVDSFFLRTVRIVGIKLCKIQVAIFPRWNFYAIFWRSLRTIKLHRITSQRRFSTRSFGWKKKKTWKNWQRERNAIFFSSEREKTLFYSLSLWLLQLSTQNNDSNAEFSFFSCITCIMLWMVWMIWIWLRVSLNYESMRE